MRLNQSWLTSRADVLNEVKTTDQWGRPKGGAGDWTAVIEGLPCVSFPASEKTLRRAELIGVQVSREVYLNQIDLSPAQRLRVDGVVYAITDVQEWDGFTVALVSTP